jgi:hypothetical protein
VADLHKNALVVDDAGPGLRIGLQFSVELETALASRKA